VIHREKSQQSHCHSLNNNQLKQFSHRQDFSQILNNCSHPTNGCSTFIRTTLLRTCSTCSRHCYLRMRTYFRHKVKTLPVVPFAPLFRTCPHMFDTLFFDLSKNTQKTVSPRNTLATRDSVVTPTFRAICRSRHAPPHFGVSLLQIAHMCTCKASLEEENVI